MFINVVKSGLDFVIDGDYEIGFMAVGCTYNIVEYCLNFSEGFNSPLYRYWLMECDYCSDGYLIMRESHYNKLPDTEVAAEVWRV